MKGKARKKYLIKRTTYTICVKTSLITHFQCPERAWTCVRACMDCSAQVCHAGASSYITIYASRALWAKFLLSPIGAFPTKQSQGFKRDILYSCRFHSRIPTGAHICRGSLSATESYIQNASEQTTTTQKQYNPLKYKGKEFIAHMAYAYDNKQVLNLEKKVIKFAFIKLL